MRLVAGISCWFQCSPPAWFWHALRVNGVRTAAQHLPAGQYKGQEIGKLTGDVYYARMDDYLSVFMVTPDGTSSSSRSATEFATWLKGELASRFKVPVKLVESTAQSSTGMTGLAPSGTR